uniref:Uncharacterized protein n=1 Tax=Rhizophora mucronata TaxID=61149 RepID=A0A2P2N0W7_RHIMU
MVFPLEQDGCWRMTLTIQHFSGNTNFQNGNRGDLGN